MHVVHVSSVCGHGGVETLLATLIRAQINAGTDAELFFFQDLGGRAHYKGICKVQFGNQLALARLLCELQPDVVHATSFVANDLRDAIASSGYSGAIVVSCHQCGQYIRATEWDCVTAVSCAVASSIAHNVVESVRIIPNAVETSVFFPERVNYRGDPVIGWVGRADEPLKDFPAFLAVAGRAAGDGYRFAVVDGSAIDDCSTLWLPAGSDVRRRQAWRSMPDFYRTLRASRGFLLSTSVEEAFGLNLLEAMACGCPVIAPIVGGIPDVVVDRVTGYLYQRGDGIEGILAGMDWLYAQDHYDLCAESCAKHVVENFSPDVMCRNYADVYTDAISRRAASRRNQGRLPRFTTFLADRKRAKR